MKKSTIQIADVRCDGIEYLCLTEGGEYLVPGGAGGAEKEHVDGGEDGEGWEEGVTAGRVVEAGAYQPAGQLPHSITHSTPQPFQ